MLRGSEQSGGSAAAVRKKTHNEAGGAASLVASVFFSIGLCVQMKTNSEKDAKQIDIRVTLQSAQYYLDQNPKS